MPTFPAVVRRLFATLLLVVSSALLSGCAGMSYYAQAVSGQLDVWRRARPIEDVLADATLATATRARLERVIALRDFARDTLHLPDGGSFHAYADLGRGYVVWNVVAAPEFDLAPLQSCFLVVGCLDYRGFFSRTDAERYAADLAARGDDVYVGGVPAYSTLGWFDDPVLNTFLAWPEIDLAELIFHELAHQRLYVPDDTRFNESFASAVAEAGVLAWFAHDPAAHGRAVAELARQRRVARLVLDLSADLATLYGGGSDAASKRRHKAELFEGLRARLRASAGEQPGDAYETWVAAPWNNARVAALVTYNDFVDDFLALFEACGGDYERFYRSAAAAARAPADRRLAALHREAQHCTGQPPARAGENAPGL